MLEARADGDVDETVVKINGEWSCSYTAIVFDTGLSLDVDLFGTHGTDPGATFLHGSPRNTTFPRPCSSSMASAIRLPLL